MAVLGPDSPYDLCGRKATLNQDSRVVCFRVTVLDSRLVALSVDWCDVGPVGQVRSCCCCCCFVF